MNETKKTETEDKQADTGTKDTGTKDTGTNTPPDRLAINPRSKFYGGEMLERGIGINFRGERKHNIEEYCVSEGWVKVQAGKTLDRKGNPLLIKLNGEVEAWFEDLGDDAPKVSKGA